LYRAPYGRLKKRSGGRSEDRVEEWELTTVH